MTMKLAVIFMILFSLVAIADEEENKVDPIKKSINTILEQHSRSLAELLFDSVHLGNIGQFDVNFESYTQGFVIKAKPKEDRPFMPVFGFSTALPNPYVGSPAYDIIQTYRNSLNIDVVTGKYYWEW